MIADPNLALILQYMQGNPIMTWILAFPICFLIYFITVSIATTLVGIFGGMVKAYARTLRVVLVLVRGWPTAPGMDADGDIVLPPLPQRK